MVGLTRRISEEHDEAINTDTPSPGGWETVLKSVDKRLVNALRLVVTLLLLPYL